MNSHGQVESFRRMPISDEIIYEISRRKFGDVVRVWLTDTYEFGQGDFLNRPHELRRGDFILIARPEAFSYMQSDEHSQIAIGKIGFLMGALNHRQMWRYVPPDRDRLTGRKT